MEQRGFVSVAGIDDLGPEVPLEMWEGREQQLFKTCVKYNVEFEWPRQGESSDQTKARRENLQRKCKAARQRQKRLEMSPEVRDSMRARQAERMRIRRSQMTPEQKKAFRQQQAERMRVRRRNLTPEEMEIARAHRAAIAKVTYGNKRLEKLKTTGNEGLKSAIEAGLNLNDLNLIQKKRDLNTVQHVQVINVKMSDDLCSECGRKISSQDTPTNHLHSRTSGESLKVYNFGKAPGEVARAFLEFCSSYGSLSEALLDLLDREQHLVKKYRFIPDLTMQGVLALCTKDDYPDVLQTTIEAMKKLTKNCKYNSVSNTIEELLFSPAISSTSNGDICNSIEASSQSTTRIFVKMECDTDSPEGSATSDLNIIPSDSNKSNLDAFS